VSKELAEQVAVRRLIQELRTERERQGLSQTELARRIGVHDTQIVSWENGRFMPRTPTIVKWASALGRELRLVTKGIPTGEV